jgi:hypothetical protein
MTKIQYPILIFIAYVALNLITNPFTLESLQGIGLELSVFNPEAIKRIIRALAYILTARLLQIPTLLIIASIAIVYFSVWFLNLPFVNSSAAMLLGWIVTRRVPQNNFK